MIQSFAEEDGQIDSADLLTFSEVSYSLDAHYTYCLWHMSNTPPEATVGKLRWNFVKSRVVALAKGVAAPPAPSVGGAGDSALGEALANANAMYKSAKSTKGLHSKIDKQWAAAQPGLQAIADYSGYEATRGTAQEGSMLLITPGLFKLGGLTVLLEDTFADFASIATRYFPVQHYDAFVRRSSELQERHASARQIHDRMAAMAEELILDAADGFYVMGHSIDYDSGEMTTTTNPAFAGSGTTSTS